MTATVPRRKCRPRSTRCLAQANRSLAWVRGVGSSNLPVPSNLFPGSYAVFSPAANLKASTLFLQGGMLLKKQKRWRPLAGPTTPLYFRVRNSVNVPMCWAQICTVLNTRARRPKDHAPGPLETCASLTLVRWAHLHAYPRSRLHTQLLRILRSRVEARHVGTAKS
jgi:hypothetical protein